MATTDSSSTISFENLTVNFDERFQLDNIDWQIKLNQHWMITGANGAGKSALAAVLAGYGDIVSGKLSGVPKRVGLVSFEAQAELIAQELKKDDADIMDVISEGTPVHEMIYNDCADKPLAESLVEKFGLTGLLDRAFRKLSTGESRKVMLIRALSSKPDLLILDEPFDGLDVEMYGLLQEHLQELSSTTQMLIVLNRFDERPSFITDIAYVEEGSLSHQIEVSDKGAYEALYQLLHLKTTDLEIPNLLCLPWILSSR